MREHLVFGSGWIEAELPDDTTVVPPGVSLPLPGTPDLTFPKLRKVINVHGCFWHLHTCRWGQVVPRNNAEFWLSKRARNHVRDTRNAWDLRKAGWKVLTVWECELQNQKRVVRKLTRFLSN